MQQFKENTKRWLDIGFAENELVSMTRNAIESSFLEEDKKNKILTKLD